MGNTCIIHTGMFAPLHRYSQTLALWPHSQGASAALRVSVTVNLHVRSGHGSNLRVRRFPKKETARCRTAKRPEATRADSLHETGWLPMCRLTEELHRREYELFVLTHFTVWAQTHCEVWSEASRGSTRWTGTRLSRLTARVSTLFGDFFHSATHKQPQCSLGTAAAAAPGEFCFSWFVETSRRQRRKEEHIRTESSWSPPQPSHHVGGQHQKMLEN